MRILAVLFCMKFSDIARKYLIKRKTFDHLITSHNQLSNLVQKCLDLRAAHFQDLWLLSVLGSSSGFFVEFGGYDGVTSSNTYVLEKKFNWSGIVAEPGLAFKESLLKNRVCALDFRAIWDVSGESIFFNEDEVEGYLSVASEDKKVETHNKSSTYEVKTVTLLDLLEDHDAPKVIDYISVDIEGSEIRVLREFFEKNSKYEVKCWTVEHNFRNDRKSLRDLFTDHGYEVVNEELSYRDYWFIKIN